MPPETVSRRGPAASPLSAASAAARLLAPAACALLLGAGFGGCAQPHAGAPVPVRLADADVQALAAILRLEDRRDFDSTALANFVHSGTPEVRRRAYVAAGRIGDPAARALVRAGPRDPDERVRAAAAFALGMLRDTASVRPLGALALADGADVAGAAVFALGRIGGGYAREVLSTVLAVGRPVARDMHLEVPAPDGRQPGSRPPELLGATLLTIWRLPRDSSSTRVVRSFVADPDTALRWRAAYALMRMGDPTSVPDLLALLEDRHGEVRALAARGLRATVVDSAGRRTDAVQALTAALADSQPHVRINAAIALAGYRAPASIPALSALLHDPDRNVAIAAAQALGVSRQGGAAPGLQALADNAGAPLALRAAALTSLVRVAPAAGLQAASAWAAAHQPWRQRFYAASALEGQPWGAGDALYRTLVHDPDPRVVGNALTSLQAVGPDSTTPRPALIEALGAADPFVRAAALGVLAARSDPADLQLFLDSYARAARDTFDDAAVAAVDALAALQKRGAPAAQAFFARFQRSGDFVVRLHVAGGLGDGWGSPRPVETGRSDAFYMDVVRRLVVPALAGNLGPRLRIKTEATALGGSAAAAAGGDVVLELTAGETPLTVNNLLSLARLHFFDGDRWHRVVPNFVAQDGDPRGDGNGGPGWAIRDELTSMPYARGAFGMALSGPDTGGSQFFITLSPQPHLDAGYTVFGRVVEGMDVVDRILQDDQIRSVEVIP